MRETLACVISNDLFIWVLDTHNMQSTVLLVKDAKMKDRFSFLTSLHSNKREEKCTHKDVCDMCNELIDRIRENKDTIVWFFIIIKASKKNISE